VKTLGRKDEAGHGSHKILSAPRSTIILALVTAFLPEQPP